MRFALFFRPGLSPDSSERSTAPGRIALIVGALSLICLVGCAKAPPTKPNVLLVTIDTLRADHLGSYGRVIAKTPVLDRLAGEGTRFANAISSAPITLPSHASMMTGLYPPAHGVRDNGAYALGQDAKTLAERLKDQGYETHAFVSAIVLHRRYMLNQGFDTYDDDLWGETDPKMFMIRERQANKTIDKVLEWLTNWGRVDKAKRVPFFSWVHLFDPHQPYRAPQWARAATLTPYDAEIAFVDSQLKRLFDALRESGELDNTLVIVTADHGESLGEHEEKTHAIFVYDATLHVPLIMRLPGVIPENNVYEGPVRHVDLVPTILDVLGQPWEKVTQGVSLIPLIHKWWGTVPLAQYSESLLSEVGFGMAPLYSIRQDGFKYIRAPRPELYDLGSDPQELTNLYPSKDNRHIDLERALDAVMKQSTQYAVASTDNPMSRETIDALQSLGYLQGASERKSMAGIDPKDGIKIYAQLEDARHFAQQENWEQAEKLLRTLLEQHPEHSSARSVLALTLLQQRRVAEAKQEYIKVLGFDGEQARALLMLGVLEMREGKLDEAEKFFKATLAKSPGFVEAITNLGMVATLRGDDKTAAKFHEQALALDPTFPMAIRRLGDMYFDRHEFAKALDYYRQATEKNPRDYRALSQAGLAARYSGDSKLALDYFVRSSKASREAWQGFYNEACLHAVEGRPMEALQRLRDAIEREAGVVSLAQSDADLASIRKLPEFAQLMASVTDPGNRVSATPPARSNRGS